MEELERIFIERRGRKALVADDLINPMDWFDTLEFAALGSGRIVGTATWVMFTAKASIYVFSSPSLLATMAVLVRKPTIFVCWGTPGDRGTLLRRSFTWIRHVILTKYATYVACNDSITLQEIGTLRAKGICLLPYIVDTEFFKPTAGKRDILVVPGDIDRDEEFVIRLATVSNYQVVRVTRDPSVRTKYARQGHLVSVVTNVSFTELRGLYSRAVAVLLPISSANHAAGQTAALEAIACGAPVLVSSGRAAAALQEFRSVLAIDSKDERVWIEAVKQVEARLLHNPELYSAEICRVGATNSPRAVARKLSDLFNQVSSWSRTREEARPWI